MIGLSACNYSENFISEATTTSKRFPTPTQVRVEDFTPTPNFKYYSDYGVNIKYPSNFSIQTDEIRKPMKNGLTGRLITILIEDPSNNCFIKIDIIEDPTRDVTHPEQYPPNEFLLRLFVAGELVVCQT